MDREVGCFGLKKWEREVTSGFCGGRRLGKKRGFGAGPPSVEREAGLEERAVEVGGPSPGASQACRQEWVPATPRILQGPAGGQNQKGDRGRAKKGRDSGGTVRGTLAETA